MRTLSREGGFERSVWYLFAPFDLYFREQEPTSRDPSSFELQGSSTKAGSSAGTRTKQKARGTQREADVWPTEAARSVTWGARAEDPKST